MTRDEAQVGTRVRFIATSPAHAGLTGTIVKTGLDYPQEYNVAVVIDGRRDPTEEELARPRALPTTSADPPEAREAFRKDVEFWEQFRGCKRWPQTVNPSWLEKAPSPPSQKCCGDCTKIVNKFFRVEEKSGPGAIIGKFRCFMCWKGFEVSRENSPHNLNFHPDELLEITTKVRAELGVVVPCPKCEQLADEAAGKATKCIIVFHNCGRPNL